MCSRSIDSIYLYADRVKADVSTAGWYQKPLTKSQLRKINSKTARRMSIKAKIVISLTTACLSIAAVLTVMSSRLFIDYFKEKYANEAKGVSELVAGLVEPSRLDNFIKYGERAPEYQKIEGIIANTLKLTPDIRDLYVYRFDNTGYTVIFDIDARGLAEKDPGAKYDYDLVFEPYQEILSNGDTLEDYITFKEEGRNYLCYLTPVYTAEGVNVCYAGAVIDISDIEMYEKDFLVKLLSLCSGFMIMIISAGIWFSKYHIIYPVNTLVKVADGFEYVDEEARKKNVEDIRDIGIHTGDEVENLYYTFLQTIEENMINYSYMLQKSKDLDEVQTGLIMILADLVENRDSSTGDHIRKTATYTGIIMYKMRELGYYSDILTEDYMANVIKAAPLHDIGKIQISDTILNKPGRLTDDEFEIMKRHTLYGADVIDQCIATLPRANFLIEAKNVAEYHHEKWNGKGYPHGLSGKDIPLSARVMAVADVFDALVSKRIYKGPFLFEEAVDMIIADSGTHFDPKVVDAFSKATDEIRLAKEQFDNRRIDK